MKTYARIQDGLVFELFSTDGDISEMFYPSLVWVDITEISPEPQAGWSAAENAGSWSFSAPAPETPSPEQSTATS